MNRKTSLLSLMLLCLVQSFLLGQQAKPFTYGGTTGTRFNGTFKILYFLAHDGKTQVLEDSTTVIDLNNFSQDVKLLIQISDLNLGLNNTLSKVRNKDHAKVFFLEAFNITKPVQGLTTRMDTLKVGASTAHYGKPSIQIPFLIRNLDTKKKIVFRIKTRTVDGVYSRTWNGIIISKTFSLVPKIKTAADSVAVADKANNENKSRRRRTVNYGNAKIQEDIQIDSFNIQPTIEDQLWSKIEQDQIADKKESLLKRCGLYLMNCEQQIFPECKYHEDVLFFMINAVGDTEKGALIKAYISTYPLGKYKPYLTKLTAKKQDSLVPIKPDYAQLDFDENTMLVNRVSGGNRPYFIGFFDLKKNKEHAVKRVRFNKENLVVNLESMEIPEGLYTVKVADSKGQLFVEKKGVFVEKPIKIPKSVILSGVLVFIGAIGFCYKKFIHF